MKPSKVAAAVDGDPSFFEGLVDAQESSGSGHHECVCQPPTPPGDSLGKDDAAD